MKRPCSHLIRALATAAMLLAGVGCAGAGANAYGDLRASIRELQLKHETVVASQETMHIELERIRAAQGDLLRSSNQRLSPKPEAATERALEQHLVQVAGIVEVNVVLSSQVKNASASVMVRYCPGAGGEKPLGAAQIQAIIGAGAGVGADKIVVLMSALAPDARACARQ